MPSRTEEINRIRKQGQAERNQKHRDAFAKKKELASKQHVKQTKTKTQPKITTYIEFNDNQEPITSSLISTVDMNNEEITDIFKGWGIDQYK